MSLKCEILFKDKIICIKGRIDETFRETTKVIPLFGEISFNLKDLISINSGGIREWVILMNKMKAASISLYECPKTLIDQVNMVKDFIPANAKVMSFYVPFYNEKNATEKNVLFVYNQDYTRDKVLPLKKVLDEKGDEMEIDVSEAKYFKFIKG